MPKIAYINSKYIKFNEAKIHIEDRGLQFADSVYEVVAIYKKNLVDFAELGSALYKSLFPNTIPKLSLLNVGFKSAFNTRLSLRTFCKTNFSFFID